MLHINCIDKTCYNVLYDAILYHEKRKEKTPKVLKPSEFSVVRPVRFERMAFRVGGGLPYEADLLLFERFLRFCFGGCICICIDFSDFSRALTLA